jgi:hypothetical protein
MRIKIIVSILLFFLFITTYGQQFTYGIKGGLDIVDINYIPKSLDEFSPRKSYDFGVVLNYKIAKKVEIQIEPGFIEKGTQIIFINMGNSTMVFKYGYLDLPLILIISPIKRFNLELGPEFGFLNYSRKIDQNGNIYDRNDRLNKPFEVSANIGFSINFFSKFFLVLRYSQAITPLQNNVIDVDPGPDIPYKIFNKYSVIGLRFLINKQKEKPKSKRSTNTCIVQKKPRFHKTN